MSDIKRVHLDAGQSTELQGRAIDKDEQESAQVFL
jgi:hypothetical protein